VRGRNAGDVGAEASGAVPATASAVDTRVTVSFVNSATGGEASGEDGGVSIFDLGAGSGHDRAVCCVVDRGDDSELAEGGEGAGAVVTVTTTTARKAASRFRLP